VYLLRCRFKIPFVDIFYATIHSSLKRRILCAFNIQLQETLETLMQAFAHLVLRSSVVPDMDSCFNFEWNLTRYEIQDT
jgi:hypothetical protein